MKSHHGKKKIIMRIKAKEEEPVIEPKKEEPKEKEEPLD